MLRSEVYDHPTSTLDLIETHISWVILTGDFAYKIKKPVNFGFLDFSTLEKRHGFCKQELTLNRRLAPDIYLAVTPITGTPEKPHISGNGEAIEYAVKMVQFPQSAQLDNMLANGELNTGHIDSVAKMIADFHQRSPRADTSMFYGDSEMVYQPVEGNFTQINEHLDTTEYTDILASLSRWFDAEFKKLDSVFEQRKHDGFVRECHGDMHLRNLVWFKNHATAFDCIEFNETLRWIDVISEIAFLVMDLQDRKQQQLANHFLNTYLEISGDYAGLSVMPFYLGYRAMVRAKVNVLRLDQKDIERSEKENSITEFESYLELAMSYIQPPEPKLIIMRGLSASGKSTVSQQLLDNLGAIRIRSDIERKRMFGVKPTDSTTEAVETGIYSPQSSQQTYDRLVELSSLAIAAGYSVIIDAAFLKYEQRKPFQQLAKSLNMSYIIIEVTAPDEVLRQRIQERTNDVSDADLTVLEHQLANFQPLDESERCMTVSVDTTELLSLDILIDKINAV